MSENHSNKPELLWLDLEKLIEKHPKLPEEIYSKWISLLDLLTEISQVSMSLITRKKAREIETLLSNKNTEHPEYWDGELFETGYNYFCMKVIEKRKIVEITNAESEKEWSNSLDFTDRGISAYLGLPIIWPDGKLFGTLCLMNRKPKLFNEVQRKLLAICKQSIETDLLLQVQLLQLQTAHDILEEVNSYLEDKLQEKTRSLLQYNKKLQKQNQKLRKLNEQLDRFLYSASHDLKAPLTSIKGLINISKMDKPAESHLTYLTLMEHSLEKLEAVLSNIKNFSLNTRSAIYCQSVYIQTLINEVISSLKFFVTEKHIKIKNNIPKDFTISSDPNRLRIIFNNLIINALTYINPKKNNPRVEINLIQSTPLVLIEVKDNGIGIHKKHQENIFDMFYRANPRSPGSGLGLFIVKETLQVLQGSIKVESKIEQGSSFIISLPPNSKT